MKKSFLFLFLFATTANALAQNLVPGTYRYKKNQNEAEVSISGDKAVFKAFNVEITAKQISDTKYLDPVYQDYIEVLSEDLIVVGNEKYNLREELSLYAPENPVPSGELTMFEWNGKTYFAVEDNKNLSLVGEYLYENGEPKIILKADKTGSYQRHGTNPTPIVWWGIETNYKGETQKLEAAGNEKMMLVVKFGPSNSKFDKEGAFERMQISVVNTEKKTVIMGERVYVWE